jgi:2-polyprenyl-3-methyl-5-hydroxy-6-metoxy-1,4-benzoquinol methylase
VISDPGRNSVVRSDATTPAGVPSEICRASSASLLFVKSGYRLVRCSQCGLVFVENRPSEPQLSKLYDNESYHSDLTNDSSPASLWHKRTAARQFQFVRKYKQRGRVLDIGCSVGFFLRMAKENGWEAYGVERNARSVQHAKDNYGLNVTNGWLENVDFPEKFFDVVTLWDVIEHLRTPLSTIRHIAGLLKDDGILIFETPNIDGLFPQLSYPVGKFLNYWPHPTPPGHLFQFSKKTIRSLLRESGFTPLAIEDGRIAVSYSFGMESLKRAVYSAVFVPVSLVGPLLGSGDKMIVAASKGTAS